MHYSLVGKVIQVENEDTIIVELKDNSKIRTLKDKDVELKSGDFISVIGSSSKTHRFEMCGRKKVVADFVWGSNQ